jgi:hypothetical protein
MRDSKSPRWHRCDATAAKAVAIVVFVLTTLGAAAFVWCQHQEIVDLSRSGKRNDLPRQIAALEKTDRELSHRLTDRNHRRLAEEALICAEYRAAVERRYRAFFPQLDLTTGQREKLETLLTERDLAPAEIVSIAQEQGLDLRAQPDAYRKLIADERSNIDREITALLGGDGFEQLQFYEQTLPQREVVEQLEQRLRYSESPLTTSKAEQLIGILADNAAFVGRQAVESAPRNAPITTSAISQSWAVLSQPQVAALERLQQEQSAPRQPGVGW